MKLKLFIIAIFFAASSLFSLENCSESSTNDSEYYMPVSTGSVWRYVIEYDSKYLKTLSQKEKKELPYESSIEIGNLTTIKDKESGQELSAYSIILNGEESPYHYFLKCPDKIIYVEVNDWLNLEVVTSQPIYNEVKDTTTYWKGIADVKHDWVVSKGRASRGRQGDCEIVEEFVSRASVLMKMNRKIDPALFWWKSGRTTYCKGKGITKKEFYNEDGLNYANMVLVDFELATD